MPKKITQECNGSKFRAEWKGERDQHEHKLNQDIMNICSAFSAFMYIFIISMQIIIFQSFKGL